LFERKCGADLSWYRTFLMPNCLFQRVPKCLGAELSCFRLLAPYKGPNIFSQVFVSVNGETTINGVSYLHELTAWDRGPCAFDLPLFYPWMRIDNDGNRTLYFHLFTRDNKSFVQATKISPSELYALPCIVVVSHSSTQHDARFQPQLNKDVNIYFHVSCIPQTSRKLISDQNS
jgi:hypothetical protein